MLSFVDQNTSIKVFRVVNGAEGHVSRERLGIVKKKDLSLDEHLEALPEADKTCIAEMIAFYNDGAKLEVQAAVHNLPVTLRKVTDYVLAHGAKLEREMVMMAVVESLRLLRKADRE